MIVDAILISVIHTIIIIVNSAEGRPAILMSPPCLESQGCRFDSTFVIITSSLMLLPSLDALSVSSFLPILLTYVSLNLRFPKDGLF